MMLSLIMLMIPQEVRHAKLVVLPGVGTFGATLNLLRANHLDQVQQIMNIRQ